MVCRIPIFKCEQQRMQHSLPYWLYTRPSRCTRIGFAFVLASSLPVFPGYSFQHCHGTAIIFFLSVHCNCLSCFTMMRIFKPCGHFDALGPSPWTQSKIYMSPGCTDYVQRLLVYCTSCWGLPGGCLVTFWGTEWGEGRGGQQTLLVVWKCR